MCGFSWLGSCFGLSMLRPGSESKVFPFSPLSLFRVSDLSSGTDVLEPAWPTILFLQERGAFVEFARLAAMAFGTVGTIKVRHMVVADVLEPKFKT